MIDRRISREYAEALFDVAEAEGSADDLLADFDALESLLSVDDTLMRLLSSPMEVDEVKQRVVENTFQGRSTGVFRRLIRLLLRKNRILYLPSIIATYRKMLDESKGILDATVTSARPIEEDQERRLRNALERMTGRSVRVRRRIDPRLIGGFMVRYEGRVIEDVLRATAGNQTEAARRLNMPLRTLVRKIKTLGLKPR